MSLKINHTLMEHVSVKPSWDTETTLSLGLGLSGIGLGWVDYHHNSITLDERSASLFGFGANQPISRDILHARIHEDDRTDVVEKVGEVLQSGEDGFADVIHRVTHEDGRELWLRARKHIRFVDSSGYKNEKPQAGLVAIMDVTDLKESEQRSALLMGEMDHRTKNLLSVIQGLARMTERTGPMDTFVERFNARLASLSANQDIVMKSPSGKLDLCDVVPAQIEPFELGSEQRISLTGPSVKVKPEVARAIAMAIHELSTNAVKYGALSNEDGHIAISWEADPATDMFSITWQETDGPTVSPPSHKGFGHRVITSMIKSETHGDVDYDFAPEGVRWCVTTSLKSVT